MENHTEALLRIYERALEQFKALDGHIEDQLKRLLASLMGGSPPTARQMAFLEGLRKERDHAHAGLVEAEQRVCSHLLSSLGPFQEPTK